MKQSKRLITSLFVSLSFLASGVAVAADTPHEAPKGTTLVDAKKVQELQAAGAILVDARKASEFGEGSLKGAISVPYDPEKSAKEPVFDAKMDTFNPAAKLPNKDANIVVFCNAGSCWKSYKAAVVLVASGYKHIYWYREGFPDWKARKLPIE
jgi:rhodanese-related sulfurtransferase